MSVTKSSAVPAVTLALTTSAIDPIARSNEAAAVIPEPSATAAKVFTTVIILLLAFCTARASVFCAVVIDD